jgi:CheY-like chemotaxis protein
MEEKRARVTILILENRQMIAAILADLLSGTGYQTMLTADIAAVQEALPQRLPAILLADLGMLLPNCAAEWQSLQATAAALGVPVLSFSCSALSEQQDVLVLRSPADFAAVVDRIEEEWRKKQPFLGMTLVGMGRLRSEELEVALRVQQELARIGWQYPLGELLVRLGIITPEDLETALREQEP